MNSRKKVSYSQGTTVIKIIFKIHFYNLFICTHMRSHSLSFKKCTIYIEKQWGLGFATLPVYARKYILNVFSNMEHTGIITKISVWHKTIR